MAARLDLWFVWIMAGRSLVFPFLLLFATSMGLAKPAARLVLSRSIGSPSEGRLEGGVHLPAVASLRVVPTGRGVRAEWGTKPLVDLLVRASKAVMRDYPGTKTSLGDLSLEHGGEIDGHASHESGRDVDVSFYILAKNKKPAYPDHFVRFDGDGIGKTEKDFRFDDARNWALIKHLLNDPSGAVTRIFVSGPIRARLLSYAKNVGETAELQTKAADTLAEPARVLPHDDHFHVRIGCPSGNQACVESPKPRPIPKKKGSLRTRR